jgi:Na+/melibiose symporter-like transporter
MKMAMCRSKWFMPGFAGALAVLVFAALWVGGDPIGGVYAGAVLVAFGLIVLFAGARSETVRALRGDGRDERFRTIDIQATAFTGTVLICALIVLWVIEIVQGHDGNPYGALAALAGVSYLAALVFLRLRS